MQSQIYSYEVPVRPCFYPAVMPAKKDFVVIDDDPIFCMRLVAEGRRRGLTVDYYTSLLDMGAIGRFENYRAAIVDFHLEQMNGIEVAEYFPAFFNDMPVLLISSAQHCPQDAALWPKAVKAFTSKNEGVSAIVNSATGLLL